MRFFMNDNERVVIREIKRLQQFEYSDADIKKHGKIIRKSKNSFYQKNLWFLKREMILVKFKLLIIIAVMKYHNVKKK